MGRRCGHPVTAAVLARGRSSPGTRKIHLTSGRPPRVRLELFDPDLVRADRQMGSNHSTVEHAFSLVANDRIRLLSKNDARGATGRVARLLQNSNACWFVRYALTLEA